MIKIAGSEGDNHFETAYRRKQFNCYAQALKYPKFHGMMLIHLKLVEYDSSSSFRVTYRLLKKACRKRRELQKALKDVINCLAKDYELRQGKTPV